MASSATLSLLLLVVLLLFVVVVVPIVDVVFGEEFCNEESGLFVDVGFAVEVVFGGGVFGVVETSFGFLNSVADGDDDEEDEVEIVVLETSLPVLACDLLFSIGGEGNDIEVLAFLIGVVLLSSSSSSLSYMLSTRLPGDDVNVFFGELIIPLTAFCWSSAPLDTNSDDDDVSTK